MSVTNLQDAPRGVAGIPVEGACDFFFGRPLDENPYARGEVAKAWEAWRYGWLEASWLNRLRGDERQQWQVAA